MPRPAFALALLAVLLAGCSTPSVDRGFVIRTDMRTTDCAGEASPADINATPSNSNPFNFLNLKEDAWIPEGQADHRPKVRDCAQETGEVPRTAGLKLQRGDTLYLSTGAVGPAFQPNGLPRILHEPAALFRPVKVTLRSVEPRAGRLYAEEDMLLAAAMSMARSSRLETSTALAETLDRRQLLLWNTLLDHLRLWRSSVGLPGEGAPGERPALALLVDHASWCLDIRRRLDAEPGDRDQLTKFFSGDVARCPGGGDPRPNIEFSRIARPARNAVQAIAMAPGASGGYFTSPHQLALFTQLAVDLRGARIGAGDAASATGAWTLLDWQQADICKDKAGTSLTVDAFRMRDGSWVYVKGPTDAEATFSVRLVFTQTLQAREFVTKGPWWRRWKRTLDAADLDKLYPRDLTEIHWSGEPADRAMCLISSAR